MTVQGNMIYATMGEEKPEPGIGRDNCHGGDSELRIRAMVQLPKGETCKVKFLGGFLSCKTMGCATNVSKHQKIGVTR